MESFIPSSPPPLAVQARRDRPVSLRRAQPGDVPLLAEMLGRLSARTWWLRFFDPLPVSVEKARLAAMRMVGGDTNAHTTLIATIQPGDQAEAIAATELICSPRVSRTGELAIVVRDDYQGRGIGSALGRQLVRIARAGGMTMVRAFMLPENQGMRRLIHRLGLPYTLSRQDGEVQALITCAPLMRTPVQMRDAKRQGCDSTGSAPPVRLARTIEPRLTIGIAGGSAPEARF